MLFQDSLATINEDTIPFGTMETVGSRKKASLKSVSISGDLAGLFYKSTIRQEYKNETSKALEVIYTFPLGWGSVLLVMSAKFDDKLLEGKVVERTEAEEQYEESLEKGNSAVMLEKTATGLYTTNLGNIAPGETVIIEIRSGQMLRFEQDRVRLCIPTVIGARYGDEHKQGGLAKHETAQSDSSVAYSFSLRLNILGDMANANIYSPSHQIIQEKGEEAVSITLANNAFLDRDFVLLLESKRIPVCAQYINSESETLAVASFAPKIPQNDETPLSVKILIDCSGSMQGDSIEQAKKGLRKIITMFNRGDLISYTKFGSNVKHMSTEMLPFSEKTKIMLNDALQKTDASMGGTEMNSALQSTFHDINNFENAPQVLLITDGDVWDVENIVKDAKKSGHRIFAIGVGHAPAESLLRNLAEQTGGACELVMPNENIAQVIVRMFHRMRADAVNNMQINWGANPEWQSKLPKYIYDNETVHCFAALPDGADIAPSFSWQAETGRFELKVGHPEKSSDQDLLRLIRFQQLSSLKDKKKRMEFAVKHQLLTEDTAYILTYDRESKVYGLPKVEQVKQMPAHGMMYCASFALMDCFPPNLKMRNNSNHLLKNAFAPWGMGDVWLDSENPQSSADEENNECFNNQTATSYTDIKDLLADIIKKLDMDTFPSDTFMGFMQPHIQNSVAANFYEKVAKTPETADLTEEQIWAVILWIAYEMRGEKMDRFVKRFIKSGMGEIQPDKLAALKNIVAPFIQ